MFFFFFLLNAVLCSGLNSLPVLGKLGNSVPFLLLIQPLFDLDFLIAEKALFNRVHEEGDNEDKVYENIIKIHYVHA